MVDNLKLKPTKFVAILQYLKLFSAPKSFQFVALLHGHSYVGKRTLGQSSRSSLVFTVPFRTLKVQVNKCFL